MSLIVSSSFKGQLKSNLIKRSRFSNVAEMESSTQMTLLTILEVVALNYIFLIWELPNKIGQQNESIDIQLRKKLIIFSFHVNMPLSLWVEAFFTAMCLVNHLLSSILQNESPFQKLYHRHPDYSGLWVLGCQCFPTLQHQGGSKFVTKTYPCVFIGYSLKHKGYCCLEPKTKWVYISRHIIFDGDTFPLKPI